jgi:hypothetical protein
LVALDIKRKEVRFIGRQHRYHTVRVKCSQQEALIIITLAANSVNTDEYKIQLQLIERYEAEIIKYQTMIRQIKEEILWSTDFDKT